MRHNKTLIAAALLGLTTACTVAPTLEEREQTYLALSDQHFEETLSIVDDPLNPTIEINTRAGHRDFIFAWGLKNDQYLRANIFRDTGIISIQGYVIVETTGGFLRGQRVRFEHSIEDRAVDRVAFDANCASISCVHREDLVFTLTLEELRAAVSEAEARGSKTLMFRIQGQSGQDRDGRFHIGEVKALITELGKHGR